MLPRVADEQLAEYCDVFCESHVFTVDESRRILSRAKNWASDRFHADQLSLSGGSLLAAELRAATADHVEWIDDSGIAALKDAGVTAVLLPGAVFNLGLTKYAPARKMIEAGLNIALATDFNPAVRQPLPCRCACRSPARRCAMTPAEAITAATINAAYSLNRGDRIGSLEVGKQADLVIFDCADYRQIPYFFGINHARLVIKRGAWSGGRVGRSVVSRQWSVVGGRWSVGLLIRMTRFQPAIFHWPPTTDHRPPPLTTDPWPLTTAPAILRGVYYSDDQGQRFGNHWRPIRLNPKGGQECLTEVNRAEAIRHPEVINPARLSPRRSTATVRHNYNPPTSANASLPSSSTASFRRAGALPGHHRLFYRRRRGRLDGRFHEGA